MNFIKTRINMRKSLFTLAITIIIGGAMLSGCQTSEKKIENAQDKVQAAQDNVVTAKQNLDQAIKDSIAQFKKEAADRIAANDKSIAEFKVRIEQEKKENRAKYEQNLADLDKKNTDMKKKLDEFKEEGKDKWIIFRDDFNHNMAELGKALKGFTVKKK